MNISVSVILDQQCSVCRRTFTHGGGVLPADMSESTFTLPRATCWEHPDAEAVLVVKVRRQSESESPEMPCC